MKIFLLLISIYVIFLIINYISKKITEQEFYNNLHNKKITNGTKQIQDFNRRITNFFK